MGSDIEGVVGTSGISGKVVEVFQHQGTEIEPVERHLRWGDASSGHLDDDISKYGRSCSLIGGSDQNQNEYKMHWLTGERQPLILFSFPIPTHTLPMLITMDQAVHNTLEYRLLTADACMTDNFGNSSSDLYNFVGYEVDDINMVEGLSFSTMKKVGKPLQGSIDNHSDYPLARIYILLTFGFACPPRQIRTRQPYRIFLRTFRSRLTTEARLREM